MLGVGDFFVAQKVYGMFISRVGKFYFLFDILNQIQGISLEVVFNGRIISDHCDLDASTASSQQMIIASLMISPWHLMALLVFWGDKSRIESVTPYPL